MKLTPFGALILAAAFAATAAKADDTVARSLLVKDHVFSPAEVKLPAGKIVLLTVNNADPTSVEFESKPLKIEKVIAGNSSAVIRIKVPASGKILFVDEPREDKTLGYFIVE